MDFLDVPHYSIWIHRQQSLNYVTFITDKYVYVWCILVLCFVWSRTGHLIHISQNYFMRLDQYQLTHWGRVTYICVNKLTIIDSDNGLSRGHIGQNSNISERFQCKWATNWFLYYWQICLLANISCEIRETYDITVKPIVATGLTGETIAAVLMLICHKTLGVYFHIYIYLL